MSRSKFNPRVWANKVFVKFRRGTSRVSSNTKETLVTNENNTKGAMVADEINKELKQKMIAIEEEENQNNGYVLGVGGATSSKKFNK